MAESWPEEPIGSFRTDVRPGSPENLPAPRPISRTRPPESWSGGSGQPRSNSTAAVALCRGGEDVAAPNRVREWSPGWSAMWNRGGDLSRRGSRRGPFTPMQVSAEGSITSLSGAVSDSIGPSCAGPVSTVTCWALPHVACPPTGVIVVTRKETEQTRATLFPPATLPIRSDNPAQLEAELRLPTAELAEVLEKLDRAQIVTKETLCLEFAI